MDINYCHLLYFFIDIIYYLTFISLILYAHLNYLYLFSYFLLENMEVYLMVVSLDEIAIRNFYNHRFYYIQHSYVKHILVFSNLVTLTVTYCI
jgi:hypothetical protein